MSSHAYPDAFHRQRATDDVSGYSGSDGRDVEDVPAALRHQRAHAGSLRFRVLGPLTAWHGTTEIRIGSSKQRALLGLLLLGSGNPVTRQMIMDTLWGAAAPASSVNLIHTYIGRLRRVLDPPQTVRGRASWLIRIGSAYAIRAEDCDLVHFRAVVNHAERVRTVPERLELLLRALALWQEPGLSDADHPLAGHPWVRKMELERIDAVVAAAEAAAELNQCADVVPHLRSVAALEPLNEAVHAWLMLCLAASGSQSQALTEYERIRRRLVSELGIEPGPQLNAVHERVLRNAGPVATLGGRVKENQPWPIHDLAGVGAPPVHPPGPASRPVSHPAPAARLSLLPADPPDFTGRLDLVELLQGRLGNPDQRRLPVVLLTGASGVGKSALAIHLAHKLTTHFPDGQLYAEMTGVDGARVDPARVLGRLLRALGVDPAAIPPDPGERAGLYRSLLAGRRVLVVLDDLCDQGQLEPLLPGGPSCAVLGTSRAATSSFPGHQVVEVEPLSDRDGLALVAAIAGADRVAVEHAAAAELVRLCDAMPLAVRVAAARVAGRQQWSLDRMVRRLAVPERRLDELSVAGLDVRAGLTRAYTELDGAGRVAFRRLGLLDAPSIATWMVAACLDLPAEASEDLVDQLTDRRLMHFIGIDDAGQPRYQLRGLARVFARERASVEDEDLIVRSSLTRTFAALVTRTRQAQQGMRIPQLAASSLAWLVSERECILVSAEQAAVLQDPQLAQDMNGLWTDRFDVAEPVH